MKAKALLLLLLILPSCWNGGRNASPLGGGFGIDVSHHQETINWSKVPKVQFVYIKATEGATFRDEDYKRNFQGAKKSGFLVGSYHFFRTTSSAHDQFENFKCMVSPEQQDLIPMVDIEERKNWTRAQVQDSLRVCLNLVEDYFGNTPMIYSVQNFYRDNAAPEFNDYFLMLGKYKSKTPPSFKGKGHYTIWQYSEEGKLAGIAKPVDLDCFHPDCSLEVIIMK